MRKLPDCPRCYEDELWRVPGKKLQIKCYVCGWDSGILAEGDWENDIDALVNKAVTEGKKVSQ